MMKILLGAIFPGRSSLVLGLRSAKDMLSFHCTQAVHDKYTHEVTRY